MIMISNPVGAGFSPHNNRKLRSQRNKYNILHDLAEQESIISKFLKPSQKSALKSQGPVGAGFSP
jgi:hypothetical protein